MKAATKRRIDALEARKKPTRYPGGLDHFYNMSEAERVRTLGPFYGGLPDAKP